VRPFTYEAPDTVADALDALAAAGPGAKFLAGGTTLYDLMKLGVEAPPAVVDVHRLPELSQIDSSGPDELVFGAGARMADVAEDPVVTRDYPALAESLAKAASQQLREMATVGGNLLQRTRCTGGFVMGGGYGFQSWQPMTDDRIAYWGQPVALVVADTLVAANEAAALVEAEYETEDSSLDLDAPGAETLVQAEAIPLPFLVGRPAVRASARHGHLTRNGIAVRTATRVHAALSARRCCGAPEGEQLLVEPSEPVLRIHQVHLEDPVARPAYAVGPAHRPGAARCDVAVDPFPVDRLVGELADEVAAVRAAEAPSGLLGRPDDVLVELSSADLVVRLEEGAAGVEYPWQVSL
jgi:xanthine dehydrogenase YagS FAD-binding subunit